MQIALDGISKQFGGFWALENVSLALEPGQVVALLGPNGAGKATLLNCLAGIVRPSQGKVRYDGEGFHGCALPAAMGAAARRAYRLQERRSCQLR